MACAFTWCHDCGELIAHRKLDLCPVCGSDNVSYEEENDP